MGRKIPVRKYRGKIKDPLGLIERRNAEARVNSAPRNPKEQEIPKSILEIRKLCERARNFNPKARKKKGNKSLLDTTKLFGKDPRLPGMKKPDSLLPKLVQRPGESKDNFFHRFSSATEDVITEAKLQEKHSVTINRDESGNIKGFENDDSDNEGRKKKRKKKMMKTSSAPKTIDGKKKHLNKKERIRLRQKEMLGSDEELPEVDFSMFKDDVKFGEVTHRPPQLTKPRGTDSVSNKPGVRDLLLKDMMSSGANIPKKPAQSVAQKIAQEKNRLEAVAAYRQLKASRLKTV